VQYKEVTVVTTHTHYKQDISYIICETENEQGLTSHQTHYRSYRGRFLQVIWPNQQCQSTEGNQLVLQIRPESHQDHSTMLQWYNSRQPPLCMA